MNTTHRNIISRGRIWIAAWSFMALLGLAGIPYLAPAAPELAGYDGLLVKRVVTDLAPIQTEKTNEGVRIAPKAVPGLFGEEWRLIADLGAGSAALWSDRQPARTGWFKVVAGTAPLLAQSKGGGRELQKSAWDAAYRYLDRARDYVDRGEVVAVEPDIAFSDDTWTEPRGEPRKGPLQASIGSADLTVVHGPDPVWPDFGEMTGYLNDNYSQLRSAAKLVDPSKVKPARVAVLDIGFLTQHRAFPAAGSEPAVEIADPKREPKNGKPGQPWYPVSALVVNGPSHGTATSTILAGRPASMADGAGKQEEFSGGNPHALLVPMRIGGSVIALGVKPWTKVSDVAAGFSLAADKQVDVISMCVGGWPSGALADSTDKAYGRGIAMFCASGDFIVSRVEQVITSPKYVVFPAAYRPVMAVAGVTAARTSYGELPDNPWKDPATKMLMLGNRGPAEKMVNAIAAWAPNITWVRFPDTKPTNPNDPWDLPGAWNLMDLDGAGTSSACPQAAAAASLLIEKYRDDLFNPAKYPERWQSGEAVYWMLRKSAEAPKAGPDVAHFGAGFLRAKDALGVGLPDVSALPKARPYAESSWFYVLRIILSSGSWNAGFARAERTPGESRVEAGKALYRLETGKEPPAPQKNRYHEAVAGMLEIEFTQVINTSTELQDRFFNVLRQGDTKETRAALIDELLKTGMLSERATAVLQKIRTGLASGAVLP